MSPNVDAAAASAPGSHLGIAIRRGLTDGAGVVAIVAFAGKNQNCFARVRELERKLGDFLADAADDLGFGLASGPSGAFPFAHLGKVDDGHWHGVSVAKFYPA